MSARQIDSVGIDIGTTTTQVIFSRLELINRASVSQVPHYEFSRREITYLSPVIFTPFDGEGRVGVEALRAFILDQYRAAGLAPAKVETGAIIITGETSKARNAREAIMTLAEALGDFVVATAGPHLESVIAGQGAGAGDYSREHAARVLNIDIGGGTSNYAVFQAGRVVDTACLNVGGHLIETDRNGRATRIHAPARRILRELSGASSGAPGHAADDAASIGLPRLEAVARRMAALIHEVAAGQASALASELLMTDCLRAGHRYDAVFISGGVGECFYRPREDRLFEFGDIGPLLARALRADGNFAALPVVPARQTLRATVIGAGAYTLSLSGSTIWLNYRRLPIRNVPVVQPHILWSDVTRARLADDWSINAARMDLDPASDLLALALPGDLPVKYRDVLVAADELRRFNERHDNRKHPLIVIARQDLGKILGMELQPALAGRELAVIDEVDTREGDYVDIGKPFFGGEIVPLTVKSLAFPS
ncbi:MAG: ethanolamine ammonia-lyase reactivating factor EutA [Candidatus Accumulibacter sp.]|jgi:ethanolamine utilization protein EutA|nr:ethanolamine ammonia-lyase reactivating factor EutA [Accumulibacter sp.]